MGSSPLVDVVLATREPLFSASVPEVWAVEASDAALEASVETSKDATESWGMTGAPSFGGTSPMAGWAVVVSEDPPSTDPGFDAVTSRSPVPLLDVVPAVLLLPMNPPKEVTLLPRVESIPLAYSRSFFCAVPAPLVNLDWKLPKVFLNPFLLLLLLLPPPLEAADE